MKGLFTRNSHVQYESPTSSSLKVIAKVKIFQKYMLVKLQCQGHDVKNYCTGWKVFVSRNTHTQYESPTTSGLKVMAKVEVFFSKVGQTLRSRSQGKKFWYQVKGLVTRNTNVQYESPTSSSLKVMDKVKVFVNAANADTGAMTSKKLM